MNLREYVVTSDDRCPYPDESCKHGRTGYCFDCVRERYNEEALDGKYDDFDDADADFASTPHPSAHYRCDEEY